MRGSLSRLALLAAACAGAAALAGMTPREALSSLRALPSVLRQARHPADPVLAEQHLFRVAVIYSCPAVCAGAAALAGMTPHGGLRARCVCALNAAPGAFQSEPLWTYLYDTDQNCCAHSRKAALGMSLSGPVLLEGKLHSHLCALASMLRQAHPSAAPSLRSSWGGCPKELPCMDTSTH